METLYDVPDEVCKVLLVLLIEIPQLQISKSLRILKSRLSQGTQTSESFGAAPFRQVATADIMEVVELAPPLPAESAVLVYVQPAPVVEYVAPALAAIHAAPAAGVEKVSPAPTDHDDSTCFSCFPAIGHGADRDVVCAAGDLSK